LLRSTRQQYHQRIAQVLEARFPEFCETQPELLAYHYTEADVLAQAIPYWQRAGQRALQRSAHAEAIAHFRKGLALLKIVPDSPARARQELGLLVALGPALMVAKGWGAPEVEPVYARARELSQQVEESPELFPVLWGLWRFYFVRAEYQTARDLAEQCLSLAQRVHDTALLLLAHQVLGATVYYRGEVTLGRVHLEQGLALYDPQEHRPLAVRYGLDLGVWCLSYVAHPLWLLGYPDQALQRSREALTLAQELSHPVSLAAALFYRAITHHLRRESDAVQACAEAAIALASEQGFALYLAVGTAMRGWALSVQGHAEEGMTQLRQGMAALQAMGGVKLDSTRYLGMLAEAHDRMGQAEAGLRLLAEALRVADTTGEHFYKAELCRLKGDLLLAQSSAQGEEAEACFRQALDIARQQQARSWELRAATSLARLWQQQGKRVEARELLAPIYGWFTEGFDTADLREAQALLDALA
jgi:predicted ATPase